MLKASSSSCCFAHYRYQCGVAVVENSNMQNVTHLVISFWKKGGTSIFINGVRQAIRQDSKAHQACGTVTLPSKYTEPLLVIGAQSICNSQCIPPQSKSASIYQEISRCDNGVNADISDVRYEPCYVCILHYDWPP